MSSPFSWKFVSSIQHLGAKFDCFEKTLVLDFNGCEKASILNSWNTKSSSCPTLKHIPYPNYNYRENRNTKEYFIFIEYNRRHEVLTPFRKEISIRMKLKTKFNLRKLENERFRLAKITIETRTCKNWSCKQNVCLFSLVRKSTIPIQRSDFCYSTQNSVRNCETCLFFNEFRTVLFRFVPFAPVCTSLHFAVCARNFHFTAKISGKFNFWKSSLFCSFHLNYFCIRFVVINLINCCWKPSAPDSFKVRSPVQYQFHFSTETTLVAIVSDLLNSSGSCHKLI